MPFEDLRQLRDAGELKALAHPLRLAILEQLTVRGPMTATEVGEVLDESPSNCSWHLRTLKRHGMVEEAPADHGRRRPWRAAIVGFTFDSDDADRTTRLAGEALREQMITREVERFGYNAARDDWDVASASQGTMWLTRDEAHALHEELAQIAMRYRGRLTDPAARPEGARLVWTLSLLSAEPVEGDADVPPGPGPDADATPEGTDR